MIDPTSMRFEGMVNADQIGALKAGQPVSFRVNGYGEQDFAGRIRRVNPAANPTTRQVEVLVDFVGKQQPRLAGLYAEGRVETESATSRRSNVPHTFQSPRVNTNTPAGGFSTSCRRTRST